VIEVRRAVESDCKHYIDVYCPEAKTMPREERLRHCGWWADYEACVFYLHLYRRLRGEVFTALIDGEVAGDIEVLPHDDCLLGPRAYINVLWVKENRRGMGIGTSLVLEAIRWTREKGYEYLDTIPEELSIGFYSKLGFKRLALQVKALKRPETAAASVDYEYRELGMDEAPLGMKLVAGVYRPGLFTWYSAWEDYYIPPQIDPLAYRLTVDGRPFVALLDYYGENKASMVLWALEKPSLDLFGKAVLASESLAVSAGVEEVFIQTWKEYERVLTSLKYRIAGETVWLSKNLEENQVGRSRSRTIS